MLERSREKLLSGGRFFSRFLRYAGVSGVLAGFSLGIGMLGYRVFEQQTWPEAFMNAAMLLSAMGPANPPVTQAGQLFAGFYALYCGLLFLFIAGLLVTPFAHRLLHLFHTDPDSKADKT